MYAVVKPYIPATEDTPEQLESFTEVVGNIVWDETHYQTAESLTDEERALFNVYLIVEMPKPVLNSTQKYGDFTYTIVGQTVERTYPVVSKPQEDIVRELAQAKLEKNAQINRWREAANESSFTYEGKHIAATLLSKLDILFYNGEILNQGGLPADWFGKWKALDNTYVPITTLEHWKAFYSACVNQGTSNFKHSEYLKTVLNLPTTDTIEKVEAIIW